MDWIAFFTTAGPAILSGLFAGFAAGRHQTTKRLADTAAIDEPAAVTKLTRAIIKLSASIDALEKKL